MVFVTKVPIILALGDVSTCSVSFESVVSTFEFASVLGAVSTGNVRSTLVSAADR